MLKRSDFLSALTLTICLISAPTNARDLYRWVQYVPNGLEARVVTDDAACPLAAIEGQAISMRARSVPGANYPVRTCALPVPKGAKLVTLNGVPVSLPKERPNKILIVGDTGCRLKGAQIQACNDMSQWPFRLGAAMSADFKPDLVIHVGDMHYRETPCPAGNLGCAGTPYGDSWEVWKEDFFAPGEALLNTAPWVMVRGNHEECERGGIGWARTLDPYTYNPNSGRDGCLGPQQPYSIDLGSLTLIVMDVSTADEKLNSTQVDYYRPQFESAKIFAGPVWYAFHRPLWAAENLRNGAPEGDNKTLAAAAKGYMPHNAMAILSGHHHVFEVMKYENDLPIQIVSGHGGDDLSLRVPSPIVGLEVNGEKVVAGVSKPGIFGFSIIERDQADTSGTKWTLTGYDVRGRSIATCKLDARNLACP
jgi:hypothetical protein